MIPQSVIDDILNKVSIVDVVGRFTEIKKSGKNHLALCPFHKEKTPSFSISEDKGLYHCFGCGASGNTLKFLMEYQKLTFREAVQDLAKMAGVDLSRYDNAQADGYSSQEKETLLSVNREAMLFYHKSLLSDEPAAPAREYLKKRKLTLETVKTYRLGFGGVSWTGLLTYLKEKGFSDQDAVKAGLAIEGKNGLYDRFKDRLIFPIFDRDGNTVGFGGRVLTDSKDTAKYINTSENMLFRKGTLLFSLHLAKDEILKEKKAVLAEGYMDVIALYQNGVKNAVAPLGTSFTAEQLAVLKRYADTVFFVFDGDDAGISAANRAIDLAASSDLAQWAVILPQKQDPFDYVMEKGAEGFLQYLDLKKLPPVDFKLRFFARTLDVKTQKVKFLAAVFAYLSRLKSPIAREGALKTAAAFVQEDYAVVLSEYQNYLANAKDFGRSFRENGAPKNGTDAHRTETLFASLLVLHPDRAPEAAAILDANMLESPAARAVFSYVLENPARETRDIANALETLGAPEVLKAVSESAQKEDARPELAKELAYRLKLSYIKREMGRNAADMVRSETQADFDSVKRLMKEKQDLVAAAAETERLFKDFEVY